MQEMWVQYLGREDLLEKEMVTCCSILAWKIPQTEEPGRLQSMESQRVRHDWQTVHKVIYALRVNKHQLLITAPRSRWNKARRQVPPEGRFADLHGVNLSPKPSKATNVMSPNINLRRDAVSSHEQLWDSWAVHALIFWFILICVSLWWGYYEIL